MPRFDVIITLTTDESVEAEVVSNDVRDYINGEFDGASLDSNALPSYSMSVEEISVTRLPDE